MNVNAMAAAEQYAAYPTTQKTDAAEEKLSAVGKKGESGADSKKAENSANAAEGVVFEKSQDAKKATYTINKMSESDRAALVQKMKDEQAERQRQMLDLVRKTLGQQAGAVEKADDIWKHFANGEVTVDEAARKEAEEAISEDGYYGVRQTSQRMFDFASALAGDDVDKMKEMQKAMEKGYKQATAAWGKELPEICKNTLDEANKLFENYYKSREEMTITE